MPLRRTRRHPVRHRVVSAVLGTGLVMSQTLDAGPAWGSNWVVPLRSGSKGQAAASAVPAAPTATATCSLISLQITVSWTAVAHASKYDVYVSSSGSGGPYLLAASGVVGTTWTSPILLLGTYFYKVTATVGTTWTTALSAPTVGHTITVAICT